MSNLADAEIKPVIFFFKKNTRKCDRVSHFYPTAKDESVVNKT